MFFWDIFLFFNSWANTFRIAGTMYNDSISGNSNTRSIILTIVNLSL